MSETTTSTATTKPKGGVLTRKLGPLPMWGWMAIVGVLVLLYSYYSKSKAQSTASTSAQDAAGQGAGGVDASLVPQFVNQTYVQSGPPTAPSVTVNNTVPDTDTGDTEPSHNPGPGQHKPPTRAPSVHQYSAPTGLTTKKATSTSVRVSWKNLVGVNPPPSSYTVAIYSKAGKLLQQSTVNAPDAKGGMDTTTITGLPKNAQDLQVHVWANGGQLAPPHASSKVSI